DAGYKIIFGEGTQLIIQTSK
uniref:Uncharacterized protein n=1 Tax=Paramormyrops kingsleyae TaxID=1676925 RepID=A0A3B3Q6A3_9TELE